MGAGMSNEAPLFSRRARVSRHVARRLAEFDEPAWRRDLERFRDLDLGRRFAANDQRISAPSEEELRQILERMGKTKPEHLLNCGACGYDTCREHALAIHRGLAEREMCLPYTIEQLRGTIQELGKANEKLVSTQEALMHSETLASMGQLAAGIAHEVNNPLGVVLMYAHLLLEECDSKSRLHDDVQLIAREADRCKKIVAGLLHFARQNKVLRQETNVCALVRRALQASTMPANVRVTVNHLAGDPLSAEVDGDQLIQVLTNLVSNACAAMPEGGELTIETALPKPDRIEFHVRDTGGGIPPEHRHKIFEPFFTTKQIGKGTGLGLSVSYGIVKMHCGDIRFESNHDRNAGPTGTTFFVNLPRLEPTVPGVA